MEGVATVQRLGEPYRKDSKLYLLPIFNIYSINTIPPVERRAVKKTDLY